MPLTQHIMGLKLNLHSGQQRPPLRRIPTRNAPRMILLIFSADSQGVGWWWWGWWWRGALSLLRDFAAPPPFAFVLPRGHSASCSRTHQQWETDERLVCLSAPSAVEQEIRRKKPQTCTFALYLAQHKLRSYIKSIYKITSFVL